MKVLQIYYTISKFSPHPQKNIFDILKETLDKNRILVESSNITEMENFALFRI